MLESNEVMVKVADLPKAERAVSDNEKVGKKGKGLATADNKGIKPVADSKIELLEESDSEDDDDDDDDGDGQFNQMEVKFHASSKAEINISFPAVLLRILPVPKEIIERQGNLALSQNMERDVVPGIDKFRSAFIEYYKRRNLHRNK
jgi:hypothetical protein